MEDGNNERIKKLNCGAEYHPTILPFTTLPITIDQSKSRNAVVRNFDPPSLGVGAACNHPSQQVKAAASSANLAAASLTTPS